MDSGIGSGAAGSALASGGGVTAAVLWLLDMENSVGWLVLSCQGCCDLKFLFLEECLRL